MDNDQIIRQLVDLDEKRETLRYKEETLAQLQNEISDLHNIIATLKRVTEVYDGVALDIWEHGETKIDAVDWEIKRSASVYQNAHNGWSWGLNTYTHDTHRRDKWHGAGYPDYDEVVKFAKDWVVHGKLPDYEAFQTIDKVLEK